MDCGPHRSEGSGVMNNTTYVKIRDRFYAIDAERETYFRVQPYDGYPADLERPQEDAEMLLTGRYWRTDLTDEQNAAANNIEETPEHLKGDVNVATTAIRIMKEREFLEAVATGDEEAVAEIERNERAVAMLAKQFGGTAIGSMIVMEAA